MKPNRYERRKAAALRRAAADSLAPGQDTHAPGIRRVEWSADERDWHLLAKCDDFQEAFRRMTEEISMDATRHYRIRMDKDALH